MSTQPEKGWDLLRLHCVSGLLRKAALPENSFQPRPACAGKHAPAGTAAGDLREELRGENEDPALDAFGIKKRVRARRQQSAAMIRSFFAAQRERWERTKREIRALPDMALHDLNDARNLDCVSVDNLKKNADKIVRVEEAAFGIVEDVSWNTEYVFERISPKIWNATRAIFLDKTSS